MTTAPHCIIHHLAEDRALYIEDALSAGKIRFLINRQGTIAQALLNADEVRVLCEDLAHARLLVPFVSERHKPYPWLTIEDAPDTKVPPRPVKFCIRQDTQSVRDLTIHLDWFSARRLALALRDYLLAHTIATLQERRAAQPTVAPTPEPEAASEAEQAAPISPTPQAPRGRPVSDLQRQTIFELYAALYPGENVEAGLEALFQREVGYGLESATYDEGRRLTALLVREKRERAAAPEATKQSAPTPAPAASPLTRDEALAAGQQAVTNILAQLRPTLPRAGNKMVAASFRALTNAIRQRGWDEPVGMHVELAELLLGHKPSPKNPLTEAEARALAAWLTSAEALPVLDALWPVEEPAEAVPSCQL